MTEDDIDYDTQRLQHRCVRWTGNLIWYAIIGCHVYMMVRGINLYGII